MPGEELAGDFPSAIDLEQLHRLAAPGRFFRGGIDEDERNLGQGTVLQDFHVLEPLFERWTLKGALAEAVIVFRARWETFS